MASAYSGIGSAPVVAPGAAHHAYACPCESCRRRRRALEALIDGDLVESEIELESPPPPTTVPTPGRVYQIQQGQGGLLVTAGRAYGLGTGGARLNRAKEINRHPQNRKFWVEPANAFERSNFPDGIISFSPIFTCGSSQRRAQSGEKKCFARIHVPPSGPPPRDKPVVKPSLHLPGEWPNIPPLKPRPSPPKLKSCKSEESASIRQHWSDAVRNVVRAKARLNQLDSMDPEERRKAWSHKTSPEREWFGLYSQVGFNKVRDTVQKIHVYLVHPDFVVDCSQSNKSGAYAGVNCKKAPYRILLMSSWFNKYPGNPDDEWEMEKTQTFIHEAAHCSGAERILVKREVYSPEGARLFARRNPVGAKRNAENYGYYAMNFQ